MNDLDWIKYYPAKMLLDTWGMSKDGKLAHRQLFDWAICRDGVIENKNESLRELASCSAEDWSRVKQELTGKGWIETAHFFLHRATISSLNDSKRQYVSDFNRTAVANKLPRLRLFVANEETGVMDYVTEDVTVTVAETATPTHYTTEQDRGKKEGSLTSKPSTEGGPRGKPAKPFKPGEWTPFRACTAAELELLELCQTTLNGQWTDNSEFWGNRVLGSDRIKPEPSKVRRVMVSVVEAAKAGEIKTTPAQFAMHLWKTYQ